MKIKTLLAVFFALLLGALALCGCEKTPELPSETKEPEAEKVVIFENGQMYFNVVRQDTDDKKLIDASVRLREALEKASGKKKANKNKKYKVAVKVSPTVAMEIVETISDYLNM